jgi:hypothetical protein
MGTHEPQGLYKELSGQTAEKESVMTDQIETRALSVARKPVSPLAGWVIGDGSPMFHRSSLRRGESPRVVCQVGRRQSRTASTRRARVSGGRCPASTRRAALTTRARPGHRLRAISTVVLDRDVLEVARHVEVLPCSWLRVGPEGRRLAAAYVIWPSAYTEGGQ